MVIVVQPAPGKIDSFVLIDVETGQTFERTVGSSGDKDADRTTTTTLPPTTSTMSTTTTTTVDIAPVAANELNGPWEGTFTITQVNVDEAAAGGRATRQAAPWPFSSKLTASPCR